MTLLLASFALAIAPGAPQAHASTLSLAMSDPWPQHCRNSQHTGAAPAPLQPLQRIVWSAPVDMAPQYSGTALLIHYTSPLITRGGTVVFPVKTDAAGHYMLDGRKATNGARRWSMQTDWIPPSSGWGPVCGAVIVSNPTTPTRATAVIAGSGGKLWVRDYADLADSRVRSVVFYGSNTYRQNKDNLDATVFINTPLTADRYGNIYFGYSVIGTNAANLESGIAKVNLNGQVRFRSILSMTNSELAGKVQTNAAPAISNDGRTLYFPVNGVVPHLFAVRTSDLTLVAKTKLTDPASGLDLNVSDLGTSSPMVGPEGSVFFGAIENPWYSNRLRGWMNRYDANLVQQGAPGAFGWDDTPVLVPTSAVPSYSGNSPYLIFTKYNNYASTGGDGMNKLAVLDPFATQTDAVSGKTVMKEILTVVGPTPDVEAGGVREWCVNSVGIDPWTKCALVNSEDGIAYRWDFTTNKLVTPVRLTPGIGEAYTPTVIGPDGRGYAINNATIYVLGK